MFATAFAAMTIMKIITGRLREVFTISRKEWIFTVLLAVPSFLYYFLYAMALARIPILEATMLNYLFPVMIVLFAIPIHRETWNRYKLVSLALGFIGLLLILTNGNLLELKLTNLAGDLLAVGAAASWALFSNLGKKNKITGDTSNYIYTGVSLALALLGMLLFSSFVVPTSGALSGLLWIGLSNIFVAYPLWFNLLRTSTTLYVACISFITPFVNLIFIMLLLGEAITMVQVLGMVVIAASVAIPVLGKGS